MADRRVRMFGIMKGQTGVRVDGEFVGSALHVESEHARGAWWSMWWVEDDDAYDILDDHLTRRDAVDRLRMEFDKRREMQNA